MKNSFQILVIGSLIGTFVMFCWGATEWLNPLLHLPYKQVVNPSQLHQSMKANMPDNGMYVWPNGANSKTEDGQVKDLVYFLSKQDASFYNPGRFMTIQLLTQLFTWLLITYLFIKTGIRSHRRRMQLIFLFTLLIGLTYYLPMWNWWGFSTEYVVSRWLNLLVGWMLAGLAVSFFLKKSLHQLPANASWE